MYVNIPTPKMRASQKKPANALSTGPKGLSKSSQDFKFCIKMFNFKSISKISSWGHVLAGRLSALSSCIVGIHGLIIRLEDMDDMNHEDMFEATKGRIG